MKEMVYKYKCETEILAKGKYHGFNYLIVSYGHHPCAYVELPKELREEDYLDYDISVHGGITFGDFRDFGYGYNYYMGWDYAHMGDYSGTYLNGIEIRNTKKWTTKEIYEDVKNVIKQLNQIAFKQIAESVKEENNG